MSNTYLFRSFINLLIGYICQPFSSRIILYPTCSYYRCSLYPAYTDSINSCPSQYGPEVWFPIPGMYEAYMSSTLESGSKLPAQVFKCPPRIKRSLIQMFRECPPCNSKCPSRFQMLVAPMFQRNHYFLNANFYHNSQSYATC